jgi:hypothetical protein
MAPQGHTSGFSGSRQVHSGTGGVIKGQYGVELAGFENQGALNASSPRAVQVS